MIGKIKAKDSFPDAHMTFYKQTFSEGSGQTAKIKSCQHLNVRFDSSTNRRAYSDKSWALFSIFIQSAFSPQTVREVARAAFKAHFFHITLLQWRAEKHGLPCMKQRLTLNLIPFKIWATSGAPCDLWCWSMYCANRSMCEEAGKVKLMHQTQWMAKSKALKGLSAVIFPSHALLSLTNRERRALHVHPFSPLDPTAHRVIGLRLLWNCASPYGHP